MSLIIQRNLAEKIWAKWESGLTTVRLKWDPLVHALNGINSQASEKISASDP